MGKIRHAAASVDATSDRIRLLLSDPDEAGIFLAKALQAAIREIRASDADEHEQGEVIGLLLQLVGALLK